MGQQVRRPDNVTEYGDQIKNTNHDISVFKEYGTCQYNSASGKFTLPSRSGAATYSQTFTGTGTISSFVFTSITVEQLKRYFHLKQIKPLSMEHVAENWF